MTTRADRAENDISPVARALSEYVAETMRRDLPVEVAAKTKLHVLDTLASILSGSRLKPGALAAAYVDRLGGRRAGRLRRRRPDPGGCARL
jgi:hypothetical protein